MGHTPVLGHSPGPSPSNGAREGDPADQQPEPVTFTTAGLPKRGAGASLADEPDDGPPMPAGTPDPDDVRARLSSLAKGLAAANRFGATPSGAPPR
jgi:hypothetical protein